MKTDLEKGPLCLEPRTSIAAADRREFGRVPGPFDGVRGGHLPTPVQIFDLGLGGCFVNALFEQQEGVVFTLKIDLPGEGWITVRAETLYCRPGGFAVRFVELTDVTRKRLARGLERVIDGKGSWDA